MELAPVAPTPSQRVLAVATTQSPLTLDWLPFYEDSQDESEQNFTPQRRPQPSKITHPISGLRALLAEEALGDFWEGFSRPKNHLQSLAESWLPCLSN